MENVKELRGRWHSDFNRFSGDLYPGRYTLPFCQELAEKGIEIKRRDKERESHRLVHYYTYPEYHEIADKLGDSLALSRYAKEVHAKRVDFVAVYFMGATAKIITQDATRVYVSDSPRVLGCSLVFGTDHEWIERWKKLNPDGIVITYINSDPYTKALSHLEATSRNADKVIIHAIKKYPGRKIIFLPDKYLGYVMKARALELLSREGIKTDPDLIEIYNHPFGGFNSCCYVHEQIGEQAMENIMEEHPRAVLMIHPECGCASQCLYKIQRGIIPRSKAFFLSTEQMIYHALTSSATEFIVATEPGLLYALRKRVANKTFIPVSASAQCQFMKANDFDKSLGEGLEIVLCDNCTKCLNPKVPYQDDKVIHIPRKIADLAKEGIEKMLEIS